MLLLSALHLTSQQLVIKLCSWAVAESRTSWESRSSRWVEGKLLSAPEEIISGKHHRQLTKGARGNSASNFHLNFFSFFPITAVTISQLSTVYHLILKCFSGTPSLSPITITSFPRVTTAICGKKTVIGFIFNIFPNNRYVQEVHTKRIWFLGKDLADPQI